MSNLSELLRNATERANDYKTMPARFLPEPKGKPVPTTIRLDPDQMRELKLCILAGNAMAGDGDLTYLHYWNIAKAMLEYEPTATKKPVDDSAELRAEIDRLSLMLLEKDQRIAELEKQVPKVRLKARIKDVNPIMCHVYLDDEYMPHGKPFSNKPLAAQWCLDRGFEVVE